MRLTPDIHLTYCSNIHPGEGWDEVFGHLQKYGAALKRRLSPNAPFGLGLRLSSRESEELLEGDRLDRFKAFLTEEDLYVFTLNGFPFGSFHGKQVKSDVFSPDWRDARRVDYTLRLVEILGRLLPEGVEGGISTAPLSYKRWGDRTGPEEWQEIVRRLVQVVERLVQVRRREDRLIHLDIEPEPDGLIENSEETVRFFEEWLLPIGAPLLASALDLPVEAARRELLQHLQVCWDTCHLSVEYETPTRILDRFTRAGILIGKVQISSALKIQIPPDVKERAELAHRLAPFVDSPYLHQVIERAELGSLRRYPDLIDALPSLEAFGEREWRIHLHVPIFTERYESLYATQADTRAVLELFKKKPFSRHLEIETYTWSVLPPDLKSDLTESIEREYRWALGHLKGAAH
jgi:sugar phosphate isomerase/epimerase